MSARWPDDYEHIINCLTCNDGEWRTDDHAAWQRETQAHLNRTGHEARVYSVQRTPGGNVNSLPDLLDRLAAVAESFYGGAAPIDRDGDCYSCVVRVETHEHDPDCGWKLAQQLSANDFQEVRRLARVLRYDGSPVTK